jgi:hypothetical protein
MNNLIHREFIVEVPIETAWQHLAQVEKWPTWAKHIKQAELVPRGEITPTSKGTFRLKNGIQSTFRVTEFNRHQNWKWIGPFLWLTVHFDHQFEEVDRQRTKLTWVVDAEGFGVSVFGRLFAIIYSGNLNRAIPHLIDEMKALK